MEVAYPADGLILDGVHRDRVDVVGILCISTPIPPVLIPSVSVFEWVGRVGVGGESTDRRPFLCGGNARVCEECPTRCPYPVACRSAVLHWTGLEWHWTEEGGTRQEGDRKG